MSLIDTRAAVSHDADRLSLVARFRTWLAEQIAAWAETEDEPVDPTASFGPREWADLPVHHPASEE
jgi:hypothetical protein